MKPLITRWGWIIVALLSLIPLLSLLKPGMFVAHDSEAHVVRVASFYQSLTEGNIFPRWSQNLNAGYGHPIFMFLYPLPSYVASVFHFIGFSFAASIKLVLAGAFIASGVLLYQWLKLHFVNSAALIGALVFQFAPYRFVNLYVRNALGEHTAFLFIPLAFLTFHRLLAKTSFRNTVWATLALSGMILAHNAVSLMFIPILAVYVGLLLWKKSTNKLATGYWLLAAGLLGLGLSAFFWLPAFAEGKYTLREIVMRGDTFADHFPSFKQLVIPKWGYDNSYQGTDDNLSLQIGIIQWLAFISGTLILITNWNKLTKSRWISLLAVFTFIASVLLMLNISLPIWQTLTIIKKFQFPWRLLIIPVFASSILAAVTAQHLKKISIIWIVIAALLIQNHRYWKPVSFDFPPEQKLINQYLGTTDTGESTPLWAVRFQEKVADFTLGVVHGAPITYDILKRESEIHEQTITASVPTQVSENTLYFPGWTVYVDGKKTDIIWTDANWRGVITYLVPAGTHHVRVVFEETQLRKFANAITLISLGFLGLLLVYPKVTKFRQLKTIIKK